MKLFTCGDGVELAIEYGDSFGAWDEKDMAKYHVPSSGLFSFEVEKEDLLGEKEVESDHYPYNVRANAVIKFTREYR
jgi:hypothetical protein